MFPASDLAERLPALSDANIMRIAPSSCPPIWKLFAPAIVNFTLPPTEVEEFISNTPGRKFRWCCGALGELRASAASANAFAICW